ncbi:hypothetical protein [uncultured Treponema sp.]|uniref:hypothetical protein n=1 Tax=uncultured Treponema sp. TaxID=162155 RepID=UPI0025DB1EFD|nr:hypothetical protein [uncultured Treponema sp.]
MGKVYLLIKPDLLKVCKYLALRIETFGSDVKIFLKPHEFYVALKLVEPGALDYVLIDVRTFQSDVFNPYIEMSMMPNPAPVVVFNDPFPELDKMTAFWISKNKTYLVPRIAPERIDKLEDTFFLIEVFLKSERFNKYINVINRPETFLTEEEKLLQLDLEKFQAVHKIPPSRFKVFKYLHERLEKEVSEKELISLLFGSYIPEKRAVLFSYICELRKACRNEKSVKICINREYKGHYSMRITLPAEKVKSLNNKKKISGYWLL